ncbi:hypothetical protein ACIRBY_14755 [Streptomyces sp. NPDC096136]|uniref:hypothetical protein n=1 Tax=Streptomyces sp. NPDC096136 TaxID=3366076 RepID=UPI00382435A8
MPRCEACEGTGECAGCDGTGEPDSYFARPPSRDRLTGNRTRAEALAELDERARRHHPSSLKGVQCTVARDADGTFWYLPKPGKTPRRLFVRLDRPGPRPGLAGDRRAGPGGRRRRTGGRLLPGPDRDAHTSAVEAATSPLPETITTC